jgi:hypothetical protein
MHLYVLDAAISQSGLPGVAPVEQLPVVAYNQISEIVVPLTGGVKTVTLPVRTAHLN